MPQRQFWTERHPSRVVFSLHENDLQPDSDPTLTFNVYDQAGDPMARLATSLPSGFVPWAMADCVKVAMEAYSNSTPEDAVKALRACAAEWRADCKQLGIS